MTIQSSTIGTGRKEYFTGFILGRRSTHFNHEVNPAEYESFGDNLLRLSLNTKTTRERTINQIDILEKLCTLSRQQNLSLTCRLGRASYCLFNTLLTTLKRGACRSLLTKALAPAESASLVGPPPKNQLAIIPSEKPSQDGRPIGMPTLSKTRPLRPCAHVNST